MNSVKSAIKNTVSISQFNRGQAGKIFEEVKREGSMVVMKNNTAECVLISPDEYVKLIDIASEAKLLSQAIERLKNYSQANLKSQADVYKELGITAEMLEKIEDVEIE